MFREPNKKFMFDRYNTAISDGETWNKTKCLRKTVSHISKPIFLTHVLKSRALLTLSANCVLNWYERNTTPNQKPYFFACFVHMVFVSAFTLVSVMQVQLRCISLFSCSTCVFDLRCPLSIICVFAPICLSFARSPEISSACCFCEFMVSVIILHINSLYVAPRFYFSDSFRSHII